MKKRRKSNIKRKTILINEIETLQKLVFEKSNLGWAIKHGLISPHFNHCLDNCTNKVHFQGEVIVLGQIGIRFIFVL